MGDQREDELETAVRAACDRGDPDGAVTLVIEGYGPQLLGYLSAICTGESQAREVYCMLAEDLWRGIAGFQWRCTLRAWVFTLARNARSRLLLAEQRRAAREERIAGEWLYELVDRTHSSTPMHMRSEVKQGMRLLRSRLTEPEQTLLMLRVDRKLEWQELVTVLDEQRAGEDMRTASARLRQRFQALKDKLRDMAREEGLLGEADG